MSKHSKDNLRKWNISKRSLIHSCEEILSSQIKLFTTGLSNCVFTPGLSKCLVYPGLSKCLVDRCLSKCLVYPWSLEVPCLPLVSQSTCHYLSWSLIEISFVLLFFDYLKSSVVIINFLKLFSWNF